jgi:hypothetical protein
VLLFFAIAIAIALAFVLALAFAVLRQFFERKNVIPSVVRNLLPAFAVAVDFAIAVDFFAAPAPTSSPLLLLLLR